MTNMYEWIHNYQLFLFDFDGLLVNTEELHFAAYARMCKQRGFELKWDMQEYLGIAHFDAHSLRKSIYRDFPELEKQEPRWEVLYAEKKQAYMEILRSGQLALLPGVANLLKELEKANIRRCVVTNSPKEQVEHIKKLLPELASIPDWITREDYTHPKPDPEGYLVALKRFAQPGDQTIGFEDSLRGYNALTGASIKGVLIAPSSHPLMQNLPEGVLRFDSLEEIPSRAL